MTQLEEKIEKFIKQNNRAAACECAYTKEDGIVYHDVTVLYENKTQNPIFLQNKDVLVDFVKSLVEEERQRILETSLVVPPAKSRDWIDGFHSCLTQVRNIISKPNI